LSLPARGRLVAALLGVGLWASAAGAKDTEIRVLLRETSNPVEVGPVGGPVTRVSPAAGAGLRIGDRTGGPVWRLRAEGLQVDGLRVRGSVEIHRTPGGMAVVNVVPLEPYVAGTVGREIYAHWAPEVLKAQAVATRTYALHQGAARAGAAWDLAGDASGQVYGGVDAESPPVAEAVRATRGEWLAWRGEPILAVFHSASGGRTAGAEEAWGQTLPYLVSVEVEGEEGSPDTYWRATVSRPTLGRALAPLGVRVGAIREIRVVDRWPSGRARTVRVRGRDGQETVEARAVREALGGDVIRSTLFETRATDDSVVFIGSGHGHGVGMSQWGAEAMARRGASYREILAVFYPGTKLVKGAPR